jgi:hypothetical protein
MTTRVILLLSVLLAACATNRSELRIGGASAMGAPPAASARTVVIRSVVDERTFEAKPREPSTPSLGFGDSAEADPALRARAIGRKRNSYGMAIGDIVLEGEQTVQGLVRENLGVALRDAGFRVEDDAAAATDPIVLDVHILEFWAWFQPAAFTPSIHTRIRTDLQVDGATARTSVGLHAEDSFLAATEASWKAVIEKALADYRSQAATQAAGLR